MTTKPKMIDDILRTTKSKMINDILRTMGSDSSFFYNEMKAVDIVTIYWDKKLKQMSKPELHKLHQTAISSEYFEDEQ